MEKEKSFLQPSVRAILLEINYPETHSKSYYASRTLNTKGDNIFNFEGIAIQRYHKSHCSMSLTCEIMLYI